MSLNFARRRQLTEPPAETARRRCAARLVQVDRLGFDPHAVIDVVAIDDLIRIADRLHRPVLHYRDAQLDVFAVQEPGLSYRLRLDRRARGGIELQVRFPVPPRDQPSSWKSVS